MKTCLPISLTEQTVRNHLPHPDVLCPGQTASHAFSAPSRARDRACPQDKGNTFGHQILEWCDVEIGPETCSCIQIRHQHATNRTAPLCAASHDTSVADMVLHVLTLGSLVPLEKKSSAPSKHTSQRAVARSCTKRGPLGSVQVSHRLRTALGRVGGRWGRAVFES